MRCSTARYMPRMISHELRSSLLESLIKVETTITACKDFQHTIMCNPLVFNHQGLLDTKVHKKPDSARGLGSQNSSTRAGFCPYTVVRYLFQTCNAVEHNLSYPTHDTSKPRLLPGSGLFISVPTHTGSPLNLTTKSVSLYPKPLCSIIYLGT